MKHERAIVLCLAPMALGACFGGCVSDLNNRNVLGSNVAIDGGPGAGVTASGANLHGLDRSNWDGTTIRVPVDGTAHRATYAGRRLYDNTLARQKGLYPTAESALELEGSWGLGAAEVAAQPGWAMLDVALLPVRIGMDPPWERRQSPARVYKRQPPGGWLTGGRAAGVDGRRADDDAVDAPPPPAAGDDSVEEVTP